MDLFSSITSCSAVTEDGIKNAFWVRSWLHLQLLLSHTLSRGGEEKRSSYSFSCNSSPNVRLTIPDAPRQIGACKSTYLLACSFSCQWSYADLYHPSLYTCTIYSDRNSALCYLYRSAKSTFNLKTTDENLTVCIIDSFVSTQINQAREERTALGFCTYPVPTSLHADLWQDTHGSGTTPETNIGCFPKVGGWLQHQLTRLCNPVARQRAGQC